MTVAWIDTSARGDIAGRGIVMRGRWATADEAPKDPPKVKGAITFPFNLPSGLVNPSTIRLANTFWYRKHGSRPKQHIVHPEKYFWPLDGIGLWNRTRPTGSMSKSCAVCSASHINVRLAGTLPRALGPGGRSLAPVRSGHPPVNQTEVVPLFAMRNLIAIVALACLTVGAGAAWAASDGLTGEGGRAAGSSTAPRRRCGAPSSITSSARSVAGSGASASGPSGPTPRRAARSRACRARPSRGSPLASRAETRVCLLGRQLPRQVPVLDRYLGGGGRLGRSSRSAGGEEQDYRAALLPDARAPGSGRSAGSSATPARSICPPFLRARLQTTECRGARQPHSPLPPRCSPRRRSSAAATPTAPAGAAAARPGTPTRPPCSAA